jgi:hypothetical protein
MNDSEYNQSYDFVDDGLALTTLNKRLTSLKGNSFNYNKELDIYFTLGKEFKKQNLIENLAKSPIRNKKLKRLATKKIM